MGNAAAGNSPETRPALAVKGVTWASLGKGSSKRNGSATSPARCGMRRRVQVPREPRDTRAGRHDRRISMKRPNTSPMATIPYAMRVAAKPKLGL